MQVVVRSSNDKQSIIASLSISDLAEIFSELVLASLLDRESSGLLFEDWATPTTPLPRWGVLFTANWIFLVLLSVRGEVELACRRTKLRPVGKMSL